MEPNGGWNVKEKKRKDSSKFGKETNGDRRDDARNFTDSISSLHNASLVLSTRPEMSNMFLLRLYPLSLERSALTAQLEVEEKYSIECAQVAYDEERERVEEEWKRGRERVRERLLEGIEERRRRLREEKDGEGIIGDAALDMHSRPPITRKLRNKLGTSPPPTPHALTGSSSLFPISGFAHHHYPLGGAGAGGIGGSNGVVPGGLTANIPITTGPFLNPHSLNVDDLPSPYPLPLTSSHLPPSGGSALGGGGGTGGGGGGAGGNGGAGTQGAGGGGGGGGRRRVKGGGGQGQAVGGLGKSLLVFNVVRDNDLEADLGEIRRGNKRRRATAAAGAARTG